MRRQGGCSCYSVCANGSAIARSLPPHPPHPTTLPTRRPYGVDPPGWQRYFTLFDGICARHGGRPHWAKEFSLAGDADFAPRYPRWGDFKALRARLDPTGMLVNPWLREKLLSAGDRPARRVVRG